MGCSLWTLLHVFPGRYGASGSGSLAFERGTLISSPACEMQLLLYWRQGALAECRFHFRNTCPNEIVGNGAIQGYRAFKVGVVSLREPFLKTMQIP